MLLESFPNANEAYMDKICWSFPFAGNRLKIKEEIFSQAEIRNVIFNNIIMSDGRIIPKSLQKQHVT